MPDSLIPVDPEEAERFGAFYRRAGGEVPTIEGEAEPGPVALAESLPLSVLVDRIKLRVDRMRSDWLDIGRDLIEAGKQVPQHEWGEFLRRNFGWSRQTATVFVRAAQSCQAALQTSDVAMEVEFQALNILISPATPQGARDEAFALAASGEKITKARAKEMIAKAKAAAEERAEKAIAKGIEKVRASLQKQIDAVEQRIAKASKQAASEATKDHREKAAKLRETLAALRTKLDAPPDINRLAADIAKLLGVSRLNDEQLQRLAHALGVGFIMKSGKTAKRFEPVSPEESAAAERRMEIAQRITYAIQTLAGAPPGPDMARAAFALHRNVARKELPGIIAWAQEYLAAVGSDREDPRDE